MIFIESYEIIPLADLVKDWSYYKIYGLKILGIKLIAFNAYDFMKPFSLVDFMNKIDMIGRMIYEVNNDKF